MTVLSPDRLPRDPERAALAADARIAVEAAKAMLALPIFAQNFPAQMLAKMAADPKVSHRDQGNCLRTLMLAQLKATEIVASAAAPPAARAEAVAVAQAVTRIEVVRADDWREATLDSPPSTEPHE